MPARQSRVCPCYTTWCALIIRCCAAVGGSAALRMRHTPCGCRSASLAVVQPNHRLPEHSTMRRASAMLHSVRSLPPFCLSLAPHDIRRGCWICRNADSWRSHVHRTRLRSACSSSPQARTSGVEGPSPRVLLFRSHSSHERMALIPCSARGCSLQTARSLFHLA